MGGRLGPRSEVVINPRRPTFFSMRLPPSASGNYPVVQGFVTSVCSPSVVQGRAADAERIVNALIRTRSVPVKQDGEALNSAARHFHPSAWI